MLGALRWRLRACHGCPASALWLSVLSESHKTQEGSTGSLFQIYGILSATRGTSLNTSPAPQTIHALPFESRFRGALVLDERQLHRAAAWIPRQSRSSQHNQRASIRA